MSILIPGSVTVNDLCVAALKECGAYGVGQTPTSEDITDAWARLQFMLHQWERKRWLVYHLNEYVKTSTGATSYSVGPGQDFDTGAASARPDRVEAAFVRQINVAPPQQPDYPMRIMQSYEDWAQIAVKKLTSFPGAVFLDPAWPNGTVYWWPVPQASIYELHLILKEQLPTVFANTAVAFSLPFEYYSAMLYNLAIRLCPKYGIKLTPDKPLYGLAADALNCVRGANTAIKELDMPQQLTRPGLYNIFSDRQY